jgi:acetyl-CoA synthetase
VKDRLAKYEYPREIEIVADLPKTTTGKVDRSALKDREGLGD